MMWYPRSVRPRASGDYLVEIERWFYRDGGKASRLVELAYWDNEWLDWKPRVYLPELRSAQVVQWKGDT